MNEIDFGKNNRVLSIYTKLMSGKIVSKRVSCPFRRE